MVDVLENLEADVARALQESDAVERRVHVCRGFLGQQGLVPYVQREKARQAQRGARIGDEGSQWSEEGGGSRRGECAGGEFRGCTSDEAGDVGDDGGAGGRLGMEVRGEVDGVVDG